MQLFVASYKDLPYELSEDTYLPIEAAEILRDKVTLDAQQMSYLDTHVNPDGSLAVQACAGGRPNPPPR